VPAAAFVEAATLAAIVAPVELVVIIPTLNERDKVALMVERLNRALAGLV
jgi:dolichol-phosphate mannosyltransferase